MKNNQNQLCWLMQKVRRDVDQQHQGGFSTFQEFLDSQQYTRRGILRYEKMFGSGYVSTGGCSTTKVRDAEFVGSYIFKKSSVKFIKKILLLNTIYNLPFRKVLLPFLPLKDAY